MADYYIYLWQSTWVEVLVFLALCFFILARMIWKTWTWHKNGTGYWGNFVILLKTIWWFGILLTYLLMLYVSEPDWFGKPSWLYGEVQGKSMTQSSQHPYTVEVQSEVERKILFVDDLTYRELNPGKRVKISYLANRLEVVTCEVYP